jgi:hypothetical protein
MCTPVLLKPSEFLLVLGLAQQLVHILEGLDQGLLLRFHGGHMLTTPLPQKFPLEVLGAECRNLLASMAVEDGKERQALVSLAHL